MPTITHYHVQFTLADGRVLVCEYYYHLVPSDFNNPEEETTSDAELTLDGVPVEVDKLPKGLDKIVEAMYNDPFDRRFECQFETGGGNDFF